MIFISYRRADTATVDALVTALNTLGVERWIDRSEIDDAVATRRCPQAAGL